MSPKRKKSGRNLEPIEKKKIIKAENNQNLKETKEFKKKTRKEFFHIGPGEEEINEALNPIKKRVYLEI